MKFISKLIHSYKTDKKLFSHKPTFREKLLKEQQLEKATKCGNDLLREVERKENRKEQAQEILRVIGVI
jgi:hypothetical protein